MGRYVDLEGARLWYEEQGDGEPLVLLHGGLGDGRLFHDNLVALADRFRVLRVDLRGHGRSPDQAGPLGPPQLADDLVAFLDKMVGAPVALAGYSLGAVTALLASLRRPDLVRRLVLISAVFHRDGWLLPPSTAGGVPPVLARLYAEVTPHDPEHIEVVLGKLAESARTEPALTTDELGRIRCRTLVMAADDDLVDPPHTLALYRALPDAELAVVPGTSHNLLLEKPGLCTHLVREFLTTEPVPTTIPIRRRPAGGAGH